MFVCTKFKIASMFSLSWRRCQNFSSGGQNDGIKNDNDDNVPTPKHQLLPNDCSKDKVSPTVFIRSVNGNYMEYLFSKWVKNPKSVHNSWNQYFSDVLHDHDVRNLESYVQEPTSKKAPTQNSDHVADKEKHESDEQNYLDLYRRLDKATKSRSDKVSQAKEQTSVSSRDDVWINNRQPQEPDCVVGHIILSPKPEEDKEKDNKTARDIPKLKATPNQQQTNKSTSNENKTVTKQSSIEDEYEQGMKCVRSALKQKNFATRREYIKSQLKLIAKKKMEKSLKRKNRETNCKTVAKSCKTTKEPKK